MTIHTAEDFETPIDIENKAKFFKRLKGKVSKRKFKLIRYAYDAAKSGHREQFRDNGVRYFEHCRETALILMDELEIYEPSMIIAALLHDMLEDNFLLNPWRLKHTFGRKVAYLVTTVTKPKKTNKKYHSDHERHEAYFKRINGAKVRVKLLKLADRLHNTRTLGECSPGKIERKYQETIKVYLPLVSDLRSSRFGKKYADKLNAKLSEALIRVKP